MHESDEQNELIGSNVFVFELLKVSECLVDGSEQGEVKGS